jgi:DTW domain-containing protein YfiP
MLQQGEKKSVIGLVARALILKAPDMVSPHARRRPRRVCVCDAVPRPPLALRGRVLVLQHPHEEKCALCPAVLGQTAVPSMLSALHMAARSSSCDLDQCRKHLGTVKLMRKCLAECHVLVGRKFNVRLAMSRRM